MSKLDDISLLARASALHDKRAFGRLVEKYQSPVRRFFLSQTLGDTQLSDDLAQETFIKAWNGIGQFHGLSSFSTWLFRIAYNELYDYHRSHHEMADIDSYAMGKSGEGHTIGLRLDIVKALRILSPMERSCVTLQLVDGYPIDKISDIMRLPPNTVKSHLRRGKDKLSTYLKGNGYE